MSHLRTRNPNKFSLMNSPYSTLLVVLSAGMLSSAAVAQTRVPHAPVRHQVGQQAAFVRHAHHDQLRTRSAHTMAPRGGGYCVAGADGTGLGLDERIINVTMAGINNNSADAAPVAPAYSDYTTSVGNVQTGQSYPISIGVNSSIGTTYAENQALAWIDFNQDQDFDDVGEQVFVSTIGAVTAYTGVIAIPGGATLGNTRMRIRLHDTHDGTDYVNNYNDTPCGTASYGEIEDYTINIGTGGGSTPANDDCTGAVAQGLSVGGTATFSGDNTGATEDGGTGFIIVWEAFTLTTCANVDIGYCFPGSEFSDFLINLSVGCPDFLTGILTGTVSVDNCTVSFAELPAGTYYIPVLVDPALTPVGAYTITASATECAPQGPYCDAGADGTGLGLEERIVNVLFAGIDHDSPDVSPVAPAYSDFTAFTGSVVGGLTYPIGIDVARNGLPTVYEENQAIVWIDFNQDADFEDAGELVFTSEIGPLDIYTGDIAIPGTALQGTTRMRIRLHDTHDGSAYENNFNNTPCGIASYGEVEDYTIDVIGVITGVAENVAPTFTVFPNPSTGDVNFTYAGADAVTVISVLDMAGRVVYSEQRQLSNGQMVHLALSESLAAGTYALRLSSEFGRGEQRFVVR